MERSRFLGRTKDKLRVHKSDEEVGETRKPNAESNIMRRGRRWPCTHVSELENNMFDERLQVQALTLFLFGNFINVFVAISQCLGLQRSRVQRCDFPEALYWRFVRQGCRICLESSDKLFLPIQMNAGKRSPL
jgi:hypothetical protein